MKQLPINYKILQFKSFKVEIILDWVIIRELNRELCIELCYDMLEH